jgi:HPt (histidine-containing phosphotransfer) domain-containing protein
MASMQIASEITGILAIEDTLSNLGGDPELLQELLDFFLEIMPSQLNDLEEAVTAGDSAAVDLQAHSIKGGSANVGAVRVSALAGDLEKRAKSGNLDGAHEMVADIRKAFSDVQDAVPRINWGEQT